MNFTQTVAEVMSIVKRPDKLVDIRREVNSAINHFCTDTHFVRDLAEVNIAIDAAEYTQAVALSGLTRFRKEWYVKLGGTKKRLTAADPAMLWDEGCDLRNKYYIVGDSMNLYLSTLVSSVDIGYYKYPPVLTDASPDFWMLDLSPYMVIDRAASKIFTSIGDTQSAQRHEAFAVAAYQSARRDYGHTPASL